MAATPVQQIQHERFTAKQHAYGLSYLSLDLSGNIAVSGYLDSGRTYIDLFSGSNFGSRDKLKLTYSKEFEQYFNYSFRYVSFFDKNVSKLVTCIGDKIEIIDTKNESKVLRSCTVNGETTCLAVREEEIFIGVDGSQTVIVFNNDLKATKEISMEGIQDDDYPRDLQVIKDTVFVCTTGRQLRALSSSVYDGSIISEYTDTTSAGRYRPSNAYSIAVSEEKNLVAILWDRPQIIVYSLNKNKSFLVFDIDYAVTRIRISDRDRMIITGNEKTGEIKMYDLEQLFSFEAMKTTLAYIVSSKECEELRKYFGVTKEEMGTLETGDEDKKLGDKQKTVREMECLLTAIEEKGHLKPDNVNKLIDAVSTLGDLKGPMEGYSIHSEMAEMMTRQKALEDERNQLSSKLETAESEEKTEALTEELETTSKELALVKQTLQETAQDRDNTRTELKRYQLDFAKESKALIKVLNQAKEAMSELYKRSVVDRHLGDSEETSDEVDAILAAEFGKLTVAIADQLSLDDCLRLASLFNVPKSDCDTVHRVSSISSPGMKLLDVLKKRKVVNMFDVTNLQKALVMLHLEAVNYHLVAPYQEKIDKEQYELYKVEEMYTWEEIYAFANVAKDVSAKHQTRGSQTSPTDDTEPVYASQAEASGQHTETGDEGRRSLSEGRHHQLYAEHSIGREGGNIHLANVSLTVPPDALHEIKVIALSVMNESPFPLDREVDTARMTPLIKLEPLGLKFKKSLQLNIPHSALISEPEHHDVIIYSGQITKNDEDSSDSIRWTEEGSIPRQLKEKSVTVDIQCLTYLSASLVSQISAPPLYIVRAVPFVDGVRNSDDDIILTICFCSDNDSEYNMLLSDYQTKLPLEQYSTLQLHRHSERDEDGAGFYRVTVTSVNNTYIPNMEQAVKRFAVSHLCTASRVSHQIRLKKKQDTENDVVDILLTFAQAQYEPTQISLKARKKDLIISEESEKLLFGSETPGNKMYENVVNNISSSLDKEKCRELATYFQLNSEDTKKITSNHDPGDMMMKTLEERSLVHSQKMIHVFEGLKACHLDETAKLVSEYINKISKITAKKEQNHEEDKNIEEARKDTFLSQYLLKKHQKTARSSSSDQSVQTTLSSSCVSSNVHVKILTNEGYTEHEVVEALDISRNRLVMARRVLQCLREQSGDASPSKDYIFLHKEQYIDENGGEITLREANVHLLIPVGAVSKGSIVSLTMMTGKQGNAPSESSTPQLSPVIKVGQEGAPLMKDVILQVPHCASETEGITFVDISLGFYSNGEEIHWRERKQHEPAPLLKKDHLEVHLQTFCAVSPNIAVDFKKPLGKKLRILPLINRVKNSTDDLVLTLWIYNDDETEHMYLLHEEINVKGKMQLHDFKRFTLKGSEKDIEFHIKRGSNKITLPADINTEKVFSITLWHSTRHAVEFRFQNKEGISDNRFRVKLCTKQVLRTVIELQFDLNVKLSKLLQKPQGSTRALLTACEPQPAMEKSFQELVRKLSGQLDVDSSLEIAGIFRLSSDLKDRVKESSEPGKVIFDELIQEQLITATSVSALDVALTRTGNVHLAEKVKAFRHRNATFPTTTFTIL